MDQVAVAGNFLPLHQSCCVNVLTMSHMLVIVQSACRQAAAEVRLQRLAAAISAPSSSSVKDVLSQGCPSSAFQHGLSHRPMQTLTKERVHAGKQLQRC